MRQFYTILLILCCLVVDIEITQAQITLSNRELTYDKVDLSISLYQVDSGFPSNNVQGLVQSKDGFIYLSSIDGLLQFDGHEFRKFFPSNITEPIGLALLHPNLDGWNNIWSLNEGYSNLYRFDGTNFDSYPSFWYDRSVNDYIITNNGNVLLANEQGLFEYQEEVSQSGFSLLIDEPIVDLFKDSSGKRSFYQSEKALYEYSYGSLKRLFTIDFRSLFPNWEDRVHIFMIDSQRFFLHINELLVRLEYDEDGKVQIFELLDDVTHVNYSGPDTFHIVRKADVYEYDSMSSRLSIKETDVEVDEFIYGTLDLIVAKGEGDLPDYSIYAYKDEVIVGSNKISGLPGVNHIMIDQQGIIWVSTGRMGVVKIRRNQIKNVQYPNLPMNSYSITEWNNKIVGSSESGIFYVDSNEHEITYYENINGLPKDYVSFVYTNKNGDLLASPYRKGIWVYNSELKNWEELKNLNEAFDQEFIRIHTVLESASGDFIAARQGIVSTYDWQNFSLLIEPEDVSATAIQAISFWDDNQLLMATDHNGIWKLKSDGTVAKLDNKEIELDNIQQIFVHSKDTLFLAGWNRGIRRIVVDTVNFSVLDFKDLSTENGLLNNYTHAFIEDDRDYLWFSTNGGLGRISVSNLNGFLDGKIDLQLNWFGKGDGLGNEEFNGGLGNSLFQDSNRNFWFSNQDGLVVVDPNQFNTEWITNPYQVSIERFYSESGYIETLKVDTLTLPIGDRRIAFFYSLPDYIQQPIDYNYKINGLDSDWISNGTRRVAVYSDIPPGTHTFLVKSKLLGGDHTVDELTLIVPSYYFEEAWFQWLVFFLLMGMVILGFSFQAKRLKKWKDLNLLVEKTLFEKERLFHSIAHELRTPLTLILHPLERLLTRNSGSTNDKSLKELLRAHKNVHRLKELIDQISDIRKITSDGKLPMSLEPLLLSDHIHDLLSDYVEWSEYVNIRIEYKIDPIRDAVALDKKGFDRIFSNLVMNAIRYNYENGIVRVELIDAFDKVRLRISNQGKGIDPADLPHIFDYLYQGEHAKSLKGTGIGLYLVNYWVKAMKGSIEVQSKLDDWTIFTVTFPKAGETVQRQSASGFQVLSLNNDREQNKHMVKNQIWAREISDGSNQLLQNNAIIYDPKRPTILMVDDDRDILESMALNLIDDYNIRVANDGQQAIQLIEKFEFDLLITDLRMPVISGIELVKLMRNRLGSKHMPVIYYSAIAKHDLNREGLSTGADIYLNKDVSVNEFMYTVKETLNREERINSFDDVITDDTPKDQELIAKVEAIVLRHLSDKSLKAEWIAEQLFISRAGLYRKWTEVSTISLNDYIRMIRIREAKLIILNNPDTSLQFVASSVGYSSYAYFSSQFKKETGFSPAHLRKNP